MTTKIATKLSVLAITILMISPLVASTALIKDDSLFELNEEDTRIRKVLILKRGIIGNVLSSDTYHMELKEDVEYFFWTKVKIESATFTITIANGLDIFIQPGDWNSSSPDKDRVIKFNFTPNDSGDYAVTITSILASEEGKYTLYLNKAGFAGIWWMLVIVAGIILLLLVVFLILRSKRKKRRKRRK